MNRVPASRTQFLLINAFALTVHKIQGLTLPNISLNLDSQIFEKRQAYVAISRYTHLQKVLAHLKNRMIIGKCSF